MIEFKLQNAVSFDDILLNFVQMSWLRAVDSTTGNPEIRQMDMFLFNDYYYNDPDFWPNGVVTRNPDEDVTPSFADLYTQFTALDDVAQALLDGNYFQVAYDTLSATDRDDDDWASITRSSTTAWTTPTASVTQHIGPLSRGCHYTAGGTDVDSSNLCRFSIKLTNPDDSDIVGIARWEIKPYLAFAGGQEFSAAMYDMAMFDDCICGGRRILTPDEGQLDSSIIIEAYVMDLALQNHYEDAGIEF